MMDNALENLKQLLGEQAAQQYRAYFVRVLQIQGANKSFGRIASATHREELADCLAEIRYALLFAWLNFQVEFDPLGRKGPDLGIERDGQRAIVEITRFRKIRNHTGPPKMDLTEKYPILRKYGDPVRDIRKAFQKILGKFPQVGNRQGIIAIWNDDVDLEELEMETAVIDIRNDAREGKRHLPVGLLFVLYGSSTTTLVRWR